MHYELTWTSWKAVFFTNVNKYTVYINWDNSLKNENYVIIVIPSLCAFVFFFVFFPQVVPHTKLLYTVT